MGFLSGVITGVAIAAAGAAWYMSRSGEKVREQYKLEQRLGDLGNEIDTRTKDIQASVNAQISEIRSKSNGHDADTVGDAVEDAAASASDAASDVASDVGATAGKAKKAAKDAVDEVTG